jgi:hypothetical protein
VHHLSQNFAFVSSLIFDHEMNMRLGRNPSAFFATLEYRFMELFAEGERRCDVLLSGVTLNAPDEEFSNDGIAVA